MLNVRFAGGEMTIEAEMSPEELKAIVDLKPTLEFQGSTFKFTDLNYDMENGQFTVWIVEEEGRRCVSSE